MVAERLIGNATIDQTSNIDATNRQLGWNFKTDAANKVVKGIYVRMPPSGGFVAGSRAQLWKRAAPISTSTRIQNIDISGVTGASGSWQAVPGVAQTALVQNDFYFVTVYMPSTDPGVYLFKSGFGNPTNGSLSGNCIFKNGAADTAAPDDETFTNGAFAVDIEIDDAGITFSMGIAQENDSANSMSFSKSLGMGLASENDSAPSMSFSKTLALGQALESDSALRMSFTGGAAPLPDHGWIPKVGRHCVYLQQKTFDGNTQYVKRRPAIITGVTGSNVDLRVGHSGETYSNVPPRTDPDANDVDVYVSY